jgi:hypothetical protein
MESSWPENAIRCRVQHGLLQKAPNSRILPCLLVIDVDLSLVATVVRGDRPKIFPGRGHLRGAALVEMLLAVCPKELPEIRAVCSSPRTWILEYVSSRYTLSTISCWLKGSCFPM